MKTVYLMEQQVKIRNANGTATRTCGCGAWLAHWQKFSKLKPLTCCVHGCTNAAEVGAHITRPAATNADYQTHPYIVPMCKEHNGKFGETFTSKANTTFVWANVAETCGK